MAGRRRVAGPVPVLLGALVLAVGLPACSGSSPSPYRVAILRAVTGSGSENDLFAGLGDAGVPKAKIEIVGGSSASETHAAEADVTAAVKRWVSSGVNAIVALSTTGAQIAIREAPKTVTVFISTDPTATGLVHDERHPEGHATGMSYRVPSDRMLALITDAYPNVHEIGCLYPPSDPAALPAQADLAKAAEGLGLELTCSTFAGPNDAADAARTVLGRHVDAVVVVSSPTTSRSADALRSVFATVTTPVAASTPTDFAELLVEPDGASVYRDLGRQLGRILRGAKVVDVPVQDPGHFLVVVNQVIARRNGHAIPESVLRQATQVIEK